ncbi:MULTISPECIES: hypothetical protein [Methylobacterium]|uniref:hypothetical protein n=1 Tax=Methylobacterium TaxID=407 RepID=UPI00105000BD|nr:MULTISPECIES: hypothetical protein [Methylobacterium]MDR7039446.1 hypothetical protein [Methylobacterium sp. BE186]
MRTLSLALAAAALSFATAGAASAVELKPLKANSVDLGSFRGSIYYTAEKDGYRVVATLAALNGHSEQPQVVRLVTTLNADQTVQLSVPGSIGADGRDATIAFSRRGDIVEVASAD